MEEIKLENLAKISSGMALKRISGSKRNLTAITEDKNGKTDEEYYQITIKSVEDNKVDLNLFEIIKTTKKVDSKYLIRKGDVVMKLTAPYSAAVIDFELKNVVAASNLAIIRVNDRYDPEYLSFILNNKNTRKQLYRFVEGTITPIIKINNLKKIKIKYRDKTEQKIYAKLFRLLSNRLELENRILTIEKQLTEDMISNLSMMG